RHDEVPASIEYPKGRILQEFGFPRSYFTNHLSWMVALALAEGVTTIGLWGINYSCRSEYAMQRGSAEYWIGRAVERGVNVILPEQCSLLREPALLYGYESHDETTGKLVEEYRKQQNLYLTPIGPAPRMDPPPELREKIEAEDKDRPEWALRPLPDKPNGKPLEGEA
ncbi:MAG: hypothetical protein VW405_20365, partial [Rhodospirillaceae bacterium]